jgi:hypothetical protein
LTICVGMFQIVAMIVLTMQLRLTGDFEVKTYEQRLYCGASIAAAIVSLAALADTLLSLVCISKQSDCLSIISSRNPDHSLATGILFGLMTAGMIVTVIPVYQAIRALERKHITLSKQIRTLVVIFTVFTVCYLAVTVFAFTFRKERGSFIDLLVGSSLDLIVDFTPFLLMFCFHVKDVERTKSNHLRVTDMTASELRTTYTQSLITPSSTSSIVVKSMGCLVSPEIGTFTEVPVCIIPKDPLEMREEDLAKSATFPEQDGPNDN